VLRQDDIPSRSEHPTAERTAQKVIEPFPDDSALRWALRDRDAVYGDIFRRRMAAIVIGEVISRPSSPWQMLSSSDSSDPLVAPVLLTSSCSTKRACSGS
jgi:hypothetical protein